MNIEQLKALSAAKVEEAEGILAGDAPDMEKAAALEAEAGDYLKRAEAMARLQTIKTQSAPEPKQEHVTPLVITTDEADNALKASPYKGLGEFLMDVKNAALGQEIGRASCRERVSDYV